MHCDHDRLRDIRLLRVAATYSSYSSSVFNFVGWFPLSHRHAQLCRALLMRVMLLAMVIHMSVMIHIWRLTDMVCCVFVVVVFGCWCVVLRSICICCR